MPGNTPTYIIHTGSAYPRLAKLFGAQGRLVTALTHHISHNGRCQTPKFMREILLQKGARPEQIFDSETVDLSKIPAGSEVVLVWTDPIGVGCRSLERRLLRGGFRVSILTGRRRTFELTGKRRRSLLFRRALEKYLIGEAFFTAAFLVITPGLVVWDWARGRR